MTRMVNMGVCQQFAKRSSSLDPFTMQTAIDQFQRLIVDKKSGKESWRPTCCSSESGNGKRCRRQHDDNSLLKFLALNALELSAPASDVLLRSSPGGGNGSGVGEQAASGAVGLVASESSTTNGNATNIVNGVSTSTPWFQLSGHPDAFAPAGPGTVWKKCSGGDERSVYEALEPALRGITPTYLREVQYRGQTFIELQDLLHGFRDPVVMDIKMGTRTFLESEVQNTKARHDLYLKMVAVDPSAPTKEEHEAQAVTKLRYMAFREEQSSTRCLGFRIEAMKFRGSPPVTDLKRVKTPSEVSEAMSLWLGGREGIRARLASRLFEIRTKLERSPYFASHEVVGSSILLIFDDSKAGAWLIDFAKTRPLPDSVTVDHRSPWSPGNHEEGLLFGLDNLIKVMEDIKLPEEPKVPSSPKVALKS